MVRVAFVYYVFIAAIAVGLAPVSGSDGTTSARHNTLESRSRLDSAGSRRVLLQRMGEQRIIRREGAAKSEEHHTPGIVQLWHSFVSGMQRILHRQWHHLEEGSWDACRLPKCIYINRNSRKDRRLEVETELSRIQDPDSDATGQMQCRRLEAMEAASATVASRGQACRHSHMRALDLIRNGDDEYGLVLEDDVEFFENVDLVQELLCRTPKALVEHPVILLACNPHGYGDYTNFDWLREPPVDGCSTSSAYMIRRDYADVLHEFLGSIDGQNTTDYFATALDQAWKPLQFRDSWAVSYPLLVRQRNSFSDIEGKVVNYGVLAEGARATVMEPVLAVERRQPKRSGPTSS